ncbi:putative peroxiredoxin bcp [Capsulimonas corticalis]|uniref:thioredoxin-dependent peroxiredoxin n=1 Tax=Capsulimonas corticalis TaxID=2219043 RepID=A0A402CXA2_9BACT|nr:thioredoxin-dependent thiol peroxidase [Capsulimonas corticalis]BDI32363.1 putative peroxiredoxin bcp [Capsulimonas corticalis]
MSEIVVGAAAPLFTAPAVTREGEVTVSLSEYLGKNVVVYFYPKDDTPGCTTQACGFRDHRPDYEAVGAVILGVSPDDTKSHQKFSEKFTLPFPLVADPDHAIAEEYGVWKEKTNYGKTYMGIERTTFVIDKEGKIVKIYPRVKVDQHAEKVLEFLKTL